MKLKHILACIALCLPAVPEALTIDFDLTDPDSATNQHGAYADAYQYSEGGINLEVTGWSSGGDYYNPWSNGLYRAHVGLWDGYGLGVERKNIHTIDNAGYDFDFLMLEFDQEVTLESFSLGYISYWKDSDVSTGAKDDDGVWVSSGNVFNADLGDNEVNLDGISSTRWLIGAFHPYFGDWQDKWVDSFKIDGVSVSAVPLPAGVWLMLSALCGLGYIKKRKSP